MILKVCIGNAVIGWIWTKGYIVGYVPKWLPAKREEIRTIVLILIENLHAFGEKEPNLEKILSFLITPEMIISLLTGPAQQGTRKAPWTFDSNFILLCHVWERPKFFFLTISLHFLGKIICYLWLYVSNVENNLFFSAEHV